MTNPTRTRRRFTAQQKAEAEVGEAVELCLQESLSCNTVAEWLGLLSSSLARWVRQARIDHGQAGTRDQGLLTSEERTEFSRLRKEVQELSREKDGSQAGGSALCKRAAAAERFRLIDQLAAGPSVAWLCRNLGVARSGFYAC